MPIGSHMQRRDVLYAQPGTLHVAEDFGTCYRAPNSFYTGFNNQPEQIAGIVQRFSNQGVGHPQPEKPFSACCRGKAKAAT